METVRKSWGNGGTLARAAATGKSDWGREEKAAGGKTAGTGKAMMCKMGRRSKNRAELPSSNK